MSETIRATIETDLIEVTAYGDIPADGWAVDHLNKLWHRGVFMGLVRAIVRRRNGFTEVAYEPRNSQMRVPCAGRRG